MDFLFLAILHQVVRIGVQRAIFVFLVPVHKYGNADQNMVGGRDSAASANFIINLLDLWQSDIRRHYIADCRQNVNAEIGIVIARTGRSHVKFAILVKKHRKEFADFLALNFRLQSQSQMLTQFKSQIPLLVPPA